MRTLVAPMCLVQALAIGLDLDQLFQFVWCSARLPREEGDPGAAVRNDEHGMGGSGLRVLRDVAIPELHLAAHEEGFLHLLARSFP